MTKTESMLATALKDIIEECPNPKTPYGLKVVETAKKALFVSGLCADVHFDDTY